MKIRKQVYELKLDDFVKHAVWEFALDEEGEEGQDEATVRPFTPTGALNPSYGMFVVRADFRLADGTQMHGYLTPPVQGNSSLGTLQPIIITDRGQVFFWCGTITPAVAHLADNYARLGKDAAGTFPITFQSAVPLIGGTVSGSLPGFLVLESVTSDRTKVVQ
jgi:hypothetical protein